MTKKNKSVERSLDDPNIAFGHKERRNGLRKWQHSVYVLGEDEYISRESSALWGYKYGGKGPGIIILKYHSWGSEWNEHYVNDPHVWAWITRLLRDGIYETCHPDPVEVFSPDEEELNQKGRQLRKVESDD